MSKCGCTEGKMCAEAVRLFGVMQELREKWLAGQIYHAEYKPAERAYRAHRNAALEGADDEEAAGAADNELDILW